MASKNYICPSDYTQTGNTCTKTVSDTKICYLIDENSTAEQKKNSCSGQSDKAPAAAPGSSTGTGASSKKSFDFRTQCTDILSGRYLNLVANIKELQGFEQKQFNKLKALETSKASKTTQAEVVDQINKTASLREKLFKDLQLMLTQEQCTLSNDRYNLADQLSLLKVTEKQLNDIKFSVGALKQSKDNKLRMVQITNYELNRYNAHKNIFKNIAFCALGVLASVFLMNKGWSSVGKAGIILSITVAVLLTASSIHDNWWRSSMNWNKYDWGFNKDAKADTPQTDSGNDDSSGYSACALEGEKGIVPDYWSDSK